MLLRQHRLLYLYMHANKSVFLNNHYSYRGISECSRVPMSHNMFVKLYPRHKCTTMYIYYIYMVYVHILNYSETYIEIIKHREVYFGFAKHKTWYVYHIVVCVSIIYLCAGREVRAEIMKDKKINKNG